MTASSMPDSRRVWKRQGRTLPGPNASTYTDPATRRRGVYLVGVYLLIDHKINMLQRLPEIAHHVSVYYNDEDRAMWLAENTKGHPDRLLFPAYYQHGLPGLFLMRQCGISRAVPTPRGAGRVRGVGFG